MRASLATFLLVLVLVLAGCGAFGEPSKKAELIDYLTASLEESPLNVDPKTIECVRAELEVELTDLEVKVADKDAPGGPTQRLVVRESMDVAYRCANEVGASLPARQAKAKFFRDMRAEIRFRGAPPAFGRCFIGSLEKRLTAHEVKDLYVDAPPKLAPVEQYADPAMLRTVTAIAERCGRRLVASGEYTEEEARQMLLNAGGGI